MSLPRYTFANYLAHKGDGDLSYEEYADLAKSSMHSYLDSDSFARHLAAHKADPEIESPEEPAEEPKVEASALAKSLEAYDATEAALAPKSREDELREKMASGEELSKSEKEELTALWSGSDEDEDTLSKALSANVEIDSSNQFANDLVKSLGITLDQLRTDLAADLDGNTQLVKAQGAVIRTLGSAVLDLIKSQADASAKIDELHSRVQTVEATPVAPRAVTASVKQIAQRDLNKSITGSEDALSKSQVSAALMAMTQNAADRGDENAVRAFATATAKFEQTGQIAPDLLQAVRQSVAS